MNRLTLLLPAVALALVLPAWAIAPSDQAKQDQANQASSRSDPSTSAQSGGDAQGKGSTAEQKPHGPTAIMDRATPTEKSDKDDASAKSPPTSRMNRATPDQKSPASTSSGKDAEAPSAAK
jgi:hypothetical protein